MRLGEVVRSWMTTRLDPPIPMVTSLSTVVIERMMDLLNVGLLTILALVIVPASQQIAAGAKLTSLLGLIGFIVVIFFGCTTRYSSANSRPNVAPIPIFEAAASRLVS